MTVPPAFADAFASYRRMLAGALDDTVKIKIIEDCAYQSARSWIVRGLARPDAVDELHDMALGVGLADKLGEERVVAFIGAALERGEIDREVAPDFDEQQHTNGHDKQEPKQATPYIPPDAAAIPKRKWLYGLHYMVGIVTATVAPGGFGKTTLSLFEAIAMVCKGYKVWYISAEDDRDEIDRRIAAHLKRHAIKPLDIANRLFVDDKTSFPLKVAKMGRDGVLFDDDLLIAFENAIRLSKIDVVILDPFISFHYLPENDTAAMDRLVKRLGDIALRCSCCIELSHHVRKPSMGQIEITVYDARGAGAIVNAVRSCRVLNQMPRTSAEIAKIEPDQRFAYIRIDSGKRNMAPPENARWARLLNVEIANGDHVQALEEWTFPKEVTTEDDMSWLRVTLADPLRTSSQSPNWLGLRLAKRLGRSVESVGDIKVINKKIKQWALEGLIKQIDAQDEHRVMRPHWTLGDKIKASTKNEEQTINQEAEALFPLDNGE